MNQEKTIKPASGYGITALCLALLAGMIFSIIMNKPILCLAFLLPFIFLVRGLLILNPNESMVLVLFGTYKGSIKTSGFHWVNPFYLRHKISLRARNLNGQPLKVNDKIGNPVEIAAVIVWQVQDTAKATFEVDDYTKYVHIQSEAAVRHLAGICPYDNFEEEHSEVTLRGGADKVNKLLEDELNDRLSPAGIKVTEARISHLAYAQEIAGAMLRRQQATAVVAADRGRRSRHGGNGPGQAVRERDREPGRGAQGRHGEQPAGRLVWRQRRESCGQYRNFTSLNHV
jgi:regulator of protease activity HflC (stomatin/prohibitin superfamily)